MVKNSKDVSGRVISEWGGTLDDPETAYKYQIAYTRYFTGVSDTVQAIYLYVADMGSDTYDGNMGAITAYGV